MTRTARARRGAAALVLAVALVACDSDDSDDTTGDAAAFCEAIEALDVNDPFEGLDVASPGEMRDAFEQLHRGVERIAETAPAEIGGRAEQYLDVVEELIDLLRGAGFDPRRVDGLAYRSATDEYNAAAISVENAGEDICT